jgi:hypothetical protein
LTGAKRYRTRARPVFRPGAFALTLSGRFHCKPHGAPPASGALLLFSRDEAEISRYANVCQICARSLLVWHVWAIW